MSAKARTGNAKNLVTFLKEGDSCADGFNVSGELRSWYPFGSSETSEKSYKKWLTLSKDDIYWRYCRRMNAYQEFMFSMATMVCRVTCTFSANCCWVISSC
jgi:hypothetical protein